MKADAFLTRLMAEASDIFELNDYARITFLISSATVRSQAVNCDPENHSYRRKAAKAWLRVARAFEDAIEKEWPEDTEQENEAA